VNLLEWLRELLDVNVWSSHNITKIVIVLSCNNGFGLSTSCLVDQRENLQKAADSGVTIKIIVAQAFKSQAEGDDVED
jgi:cellobiose-specific phosphotransferase system component IIB